MAPSYLIETRRFIFIRINTLIVLKLQELGELGFQEYLGGSQKIDLRIMRLSVFAG